MLKLSKNTLGMLIAKYRAVLLRLRRGAVVSVAAAGLLLAAPALASEYHVFTTLDALRQAGVSYADGDTIILHQNDSSLTAPLSFGGKSVTLRGGVDGVTLQPAAGSAVQLINDPSGVITLAGLVIENFTATGSYGAYGGAINGNTVTLSGGENSFSGNTATANYTSSAVNTAVAGTYAEGGAINGNTVTLSGGESSFSGNTVTNTLTASASVSAEAYAHACGGAIYGTAVIISGGENSFSGNTVTADAYAYAYTADAYAYAYGGAIYGTAVIISGGTNSFSGNTANDGGAIYSNGAVTLSGGTNSFSNNTADGINARGGAIYGCDNVTLIAKDGDIRFSGNTHRQGGATALPNAVYLENSNNSSELTLAAQAGRSILFYDPVASNSDADHRDLTITINPDDADDGTVRFDTHQSDIYGNTTVSNGTLALTNGAVYGADGNTGSFTLNSGAALSADAAGGAINAGAITLAAGSTTAVDTSGGNHLTLNGAVSIDGNASLDLTGYSAGGAAVLVSDQAITGSFGKLTAAGQTLDASPLSLTKFLNGATLYKTNSDKTVNVILHGLVWNNTAPGTAHGTFNIATDFTLADTLALADNPDIHARGFGWDGATLTKTGDGNLTLTGANTYSGGTVISDGRLTVNNLANLGSGSITNNAELYFAPGGGRQTINFANRYVGSGTLGLNASLTAAEQWSDLVQFTNAPQDNTKIYFSFTAGSDLRYLTEDGLHFAELDTPDGNADSFSLAGISLAGARLLAVKTSDNQNYYLTGAFNPSAAKVYSETAAGTLGQAAGLHGQETFKHIGQAAAGAAGGQTGVYAGMGRGDVRHNSGSHADVKGNNLALALAWENGSTTWGILGQKFDGSYTTTHSADLGGATQTIHSNGDLKQHDLGLFAEYRPDDSDRYWQGLLKAGKSQNDFRADNANGGSRFRSDRGVFGLSLGGGFVKEAAPGRSLETYQHLIYTRLGTDRITDSLGQDIRFDSDDSLRLLAGLRWTLEREGKAGFYAGAALDYEFRGKTGATIDGERADSASLQGLTGILELGFSAKQSDTLTIDGAVYGYVGKKEGITGSLTLNKKF